MPEADHPDYLSHKYLVDVEKQAEDTIYQQALSEATQLINQDWGLHDLEKEQAIE